MFLLYPDKYSPINIILRMHKYQQYNKNSEIKELNTNDKIGFNLLNYRVKIIRMHLKVKIL